MELDHLKEVKAIKGFRTWTCGRIIIVLVWMLVILPCTDRSRLEWFKGKECSAWWITWLVHWWRTQPTATNVLRIADRIIDSLNANGTHLLQEASKAVWASLIRYLPTFKQWGKWVATLPTRITCWPCTSGIKISSAATPLRPNQDTTAAAKFTYQRRSRVVLNIYLWFGNHWQ